MKRRITAVAAVLLAVTSVAVFLIAALRFIATHACGGQCSAPWVYQVSFPQGTSPAVIEKALDRCADLPVVRSVDPKVSDHYEPHVRTSSRDEVQIRQVESRLQTGAQRASTSPTEP